MKSNKTQTVWIGLYKVASGLGANKFYTVNGEEASYTNWKQLEPNDFGGEEDCVELVYMASYFTGDVGGKWNDNSCDKKQAKNYVCQK